MAGVLDTKKSLPGTGREPFELIPEESYPELSSILLQDVPNSLPALGMVENAIRWRKIANAPTYQKLYAPSGDFRNGTCIGFFDLCLSQTVTFYTRDAQDQKLREALITTGLFNWNSGDKKERWLPEVSEELVPIVEELATQRNIQTCYFRTVHFWMEKEQAIALKVRCPAGVKLGPLFTDHIPYLDQYWPHRSPGSAEYLRALLERNFGIGVFVEGNGMPVGWIVLNQNSCMAMLYVLEAYRRRGYAELVCNAMAKKLAGAGVYPRANTLENNHSSIALFTKMGYQSSHGYNAIELKTM